MRTIALFTPESIFRTRVSRPMCFSWRRRSVKSRAVPRARLQVGRGTLIRAESLHREIERGEIFGMHVLGGIRAEDLGRGITEDLSLIHISEPTRLLSISYAVFCL